MYLAAHAKKIVGYSFEESQKLIWELIDHCTQPKVGQCSFNFSMFQDLIPMCIIQYVFSMEWLSGGDMVWWDNRQSMHRANPYTEAMTARDVRRSTIIDDGPLSYGVTEAGRLTAGSTSPLAT
jgi:alpha-ketoglutarate-dependent 2,4-dichlorophenoxyacetate dioxygenase